ncbi:MAG: DegT/DnrJ/EryC1/StrS family aminotransferase [Sulfurimonas sp.]|jgi:UDP-2-acetamido-2-deoxy-ribo-hexuluronate aminotransferase
MKIDFANLQYQHRLYQDEIEEAILKVSRNCNYIMGKEVQELEKALENFTGVKYAITCASGTDALLLALMAIGIKSGDEVITTPFTFIATAETIAILGAKPVFVDIDEQTYNIEPSKIEAKITSKTKAILPVSLFGQPAKMDELQEIADKNKLKVIVDGAQSFGSTYKDKTDSLLGDISITSFFPAKPLGCYGDGGACFTNNKVLAEKIQALRVHGQIQRYQHKFIGLGARLDTIQAAVLSVKLKYYKKDLSLRQTVASKYTKALQNSRDIVLPYLEVDTSSAWAQYSIRVKNRGQLQEQLQQNGIPTAIHYPTPLHLQECFEYLGYKKGDLPISESVAEEILSLPMNPYLSDEEIAYIVKNIEQALL